MPSRFTESQRTHVRALLQNNGQQLFATYGLRKTSVEELAKAASISKGAFYLFYESKEALFFDLLEQYETEYQASLLREIAQHEIPPPERMRAMLLKALRLWKQNALFTHFSREEYGYLLRKLPPERVAAHLHNDNTFAEAFRAAWAAAGVTLSYPPPLVSGLIRALFFVSLHEGDFGEGLYQPVLEVLVDLLADKLVAAPLEGQQTGKSEP